MFVDIISKPLDFEQMGMGWIRNNLVGKKNLTDKLLSRKYSVALINIIIMKITSS